jgi:hypothetical protein
MNYSKEGAAAFLRLVEEVRIDLKEETSISEVGAAEEGVVAGHG